MKKPIDPNLNKNGSDLFLGGSRDSKPKSSPIEPKVGDDIESILMSGTSSKDKKADNFEITAYNQADQTKEYHHHHQHHHHHHHGGSHHRSHRHNKKKMPKATKILLVILAIILLIVTIIGITFLVLRSQGEKNIKPTNTNSEYEDIIEYKGEKYRYNRDVISIAFFGVDQEKMYSTKDAEFVGCTDADILVTVNTKTGESKVIAVPRDTMVDVDQYNKDGEFVKTGNVQLCLAYAYGDGREKSCSNAVNAMSRILYDVPIEKYFVLNLEGVAPINDSIGGVIVDSIYDLPQFGISKGKTVRLMGDAAKAYVRTRDMDTINASLNRTQRQVQYINAFAKQVVPAVLKDFGVVSDLYNTAAAYSQTNLSLSDATYLASLLLSKGVTSFETYTLQGEMKEATSTEYPDAVYAEFYPDEELLMNTILEVFYEKAE